MYNLYKNIKISDSKKNFDANWTFENYKTNYLTHNFHPFPAKFIPQIPNKLINNLSSESDVVLDPFCGSGTSLVEATILGRNAIGVDINPVSCLISEVKTTKLNLGDVEEINDLLKELKEEKNGITKKITIDPPEIPNINHWFQKNVIIEIQVIFSLIKKLNSRNAQNFCKCAMSAILLKHSNQKGETTYSSTNKNIISGAIFYSFDSKVKSMMKRMDEYSKERKNVNVKVFLDDSRYLKKVKETVQLVVTSPPYPNAFDYYLYHRHRLYWLGFDPKEVKAKEIGSHLNYQRNGKGILDFEEDMKKCFERLYELIDEKGHCCFVIGDSIFNGKLVHNDKLIEKIANKIGFVTERNISRSIHDTKRSFTASARRAKGEHILILRK
ncbi:site-specific DNA-methyltransferase [Candidatus Micrarchaeota archaeon]|nr:site-specific DNA-methyltransferase [Candidatus Micrarchaeota archaeon]